MTAALYNFPVLSTRFIGRTTELENLAQLLATPGVLVALVGTGGCGKTRLAQECAAGIAPLYPGGVWFIDLAPLTDEALIPATVAAVLGIRDQPEQAIGATLVHAFADKTLLLVLDNCEQVRAGCAEFVATLRAACPAVTVLATSRAALDLADEQVFPLTPLTQTDAIELFVERAHTAATYFQRNESNKDTIADICARLDNLPLAVELAAARVNMLAPAQIAARLDARLRFLRNANPQVPERQTTLRALLEWSDDLLDDAERALFQSLGIFPASFDLEAVESVCDTASRANPSSSAPHPLDTLTGLAAKSLIIVEPGTTQTRYRLLETIRAFAREKMDAAGNTVHGRQKHLVYFLQFAERAEPFLSSSQQLEWAARLDAEQENLRAALRFATDTAQTAHGLRLANALWRYWNMRGHFYEGAAWFDALAALPTDDIPAAVRAKAFFSSGALYFRLGDLERGTQLGIKSLEIQRELDAQRDMTVTINMLGVIASERGDYTQAIEWHTQALTLRRALGDEWGIAASLNNLGLAARAQGNFRRAREYYEASLEKKRATGNRAEINVGLVNIGEVETLSGNYARAAALLQECVELSTGLGDDYNLAMALANLAVPVRALGDNAAARQLSLRAIEIAQRHGDIDEEAIALVNLGDLTRDEGELGHAAAQYEQAVSLLRPKQHVRLLPIALNGLGVIRRMQGDLVTATTLHYDAFCIYQEAHNRLGIAEAVEGLAGVAQQWNEPDRALAWLGAARALREDMGTPIYSFDQPLIDAIETRAAAALGAGAATEAKLRGRALDMDALAREIEVWQARVTRPVSVTASPPDLEFLAFGKTRVLRKGVLLSSKDWRYAKAREVVFYLLTRESVSKEQLALDLWPDASPEQIRRALHRALYHARRALGEGEWILFDRDRYAFQRASPYAYDVEQFARALAEAHARKHSDEPAAFAQALGRAVQIYDGDFLTDVESEWAAAERAARREQFFDAATKLGAALIAQARYADAAAVYEKTLVQDNLNEQAMGELMRSLAHMGDAAGAIRRYKAFRQRVYDELAADVSSKLRSLYEQLRRGESI